MKVCPNTNPSLRLKILLSFAMENALFTRMVDILDPHQIISLFLSWFPVKKENLDMFWEEW